MSTAAHPSEAKQAIADRQPAMLRLRVSVRRAALTRQLVDGADPAATPELALRARQLTSIRSRRRLARALRSAVAEARRPSLSRMPIVSRRPVLAAVEALDALVKRLHSPEAVGEQGMALVYRLITDGAWSPLYGSDDPDALRRLVATATAALDTPQPDRAARAQTPQNAAMGASAR